MTEPIPKVIPTYQEIINRQTDTCQVPIIQPLMKGSFDLNAFNQLFEQTKQTANSDRA